MMEALVDLSRRQKGKGDWTLDSVRASQMPTSWRKINIGSPRRGEGGERVAERGNKVHLNLTNFF